MKMPKMIKRYCSHCKAHNTHKVTQVKNKGRNAAHPLSIGSTHRLRARGKRRGFGNLGKYSKPPKPRRTGVKVTKRIAFVFECQECHKKSLSKEGVRARKVEIK